MSTIKEASLKQNLGDCEDVDMISQLPDELLLKVLLFLPTKVAASTSILSKRWEFLWMWLSKLEYVHSNDSVPELASLQSFIYFNLPLHKAQVIESFRLKLRKERTWTRIVKPEYINTWVVIVVSRCVRELNLNISCMRNPTSLPSSLYTCKSLVILKLKDQILVAVLPRMACLPSLKTLFLRRVDYSYESSLQKLLSICPVLENLFVERDGLEEYSRYFNTLSVTVPSLLRLTLKISRGSQFDELVIDTPSLKYFKITDYKGEYETEGGDDSYSFNFKDMPNLEEADIISTYPDIDKFVRSITSVKRLSLCVRVNAEEALYNEGIFFNQLENLKLCPCDSNWSKLLVRLLKDSPNLRELEVSLNDDHKNSCVDPPVCWENQLNCVPECLLSTLGTFKWTGIHGSPKVMDLAKYILRNARCLKTATILFQSALETEDEREIMIQELLLSFRGSTTHTTIMCSFI